MPHDGNARRESGGSPGRPTKPFDAP